MCKDLVGKFKKIIYDIADDLYEINDESGVCIHCPFFSSNLSNSCQARSYDPYFNFSSHSNFEIKTV